MSQRTHSPLLIREQILKENFKGEQAETASRTKQLALRIILKLVIWWSGQHHLDCFKHS